MDRKPTQGFTLIELMVVLALLGIFVAVAVPGFNRFVENNRTQATHNEVIELLRYGRTLAVTDRMTVTVCIDDAALMATKGTCAAGEPLRGLEPAPAVIVNSNVNEISFRANGTAVGGEIATCHQSDYQRGFFVNVEASGAISTFPRGQTKSGAMTTCEP